MIRAVSYGGGVQSNALLVLAAQGTIDFPLFIFANTGDDSEHPDTLAYVRDIAMPYAAQHGIEMVIVQKKLKDGTPQTLYDSLTREEKSMEVIPMYGKTGGPGIRACTAHFKSRVIAKELRRRGAKAKNKALLALGISLDEWHRARTTSRINHEILTYPLLDMRLNRNACCTIIEKAGLPIPRKSACFFCPYHNRATWVQMQRESPALFDRAVALERHINARREEKGKPAVFLSRDVIPLDQVIVDVGQQAFDFDNLAVCESGYCEVPA